MKNESTPSEGWEERFNKLVKEFKDNTVWITHLIFKDFIQEEIAKARQEITDWSLEQQEKAYSIGRDIGRQEERREIVDKLKDACSDYCFIGDGSSDSSEETMRMSEHLIKHMGLEYLEEE
jgi:hypothetical protein